MEVINTLRSLKINKLDNDNEAIYQLVYSMANVTKTIIIDLYRKVGVEASMLYGNVELLDDEPIGTLLVQVKGDKTKQQETVDYLRKEKVAVTRLNEKGIFMSSWFSRVFPNVVQLGWLGDTGWEPAFSNIIYDFWWNIWGILGLIFGVILVLTKSDGIRPNKFWFNVCDKIVSIFRAIPFIILLAFIAPVTQKIVGTQIGIKAALVPLTLGVFPFMPVKFKWL